LLLFLFFEVEGSELKKIRPNSRVYQRYYLLDAGLQALFWEPSKKESDKARIFLDSIREDSLRLRWLEQLFSSAADLNKQEVIEEGIPLQSAVKLVQSVNPGVSSGKVEHRFKEIQRLREKMCTLALHSESGLKDHAENEKPSERKDQVSRQEFIEVFHDFCTRPEIYFLLVQFSSNKEYLDAKDLMRFIEAEQGVAQTHEPSEEGRQLGHLSLDGFTSYLTSSECHLFDREHDTICQDMTQPLSHYYINSSHNTYLIEDQFQGPSDISGYIRALKMGCRCVEVDVWDGPDGEPVVCTGHSLSRPLVLRSVLEAIGRFAFVASEYPLILCIENHCSVQQQKVLLKHLTRILGERLYKDLPDEEALYLPSPHSLRHRILLKGKKLGPVSGGEDGEASEEDEGAEMSQRIKALNAGGTEKDVVQKSVSLASVPQSNMTHPSPKRFQLLRELSDLVTLCHSVCFKDFKTSTKTQKPWELCSFHESLALHLAGDSPGDFVNHNKHFLSRVYPNPMRIDSSNMNPQDLWKCGCQIVSMNFQTAGLMMDLNTAWFRQNGRCGYVLRPAIMRQKVSYFSADTKDTVPGVSPQLLHVKVEHKSLKAKFALC
ncbi:hypothetical protein XENOCAPTIV_027580, partial [Xenoophorus captivus]